MSKYESVAHYYWPTRPKQASVPKYVYYPSLKALVWTVNWVEQITQINIAAIMVLA